MAVTLIDPAHAALGDVAVWHLALDQALPPGATLVPGEGVDEQGNPYRAAWCRVTLGLSHSPRPWAVYRGQPGDEIPGLGSST